MNEQKLFMKNSYKVTKLLSVVEAEEMASKLLGNKSFSEMHSNGYSCEGKVKLGTIVSAAKMKEHLVKMYSGLVEDFVSENGYEIEMLSFYCNVMRSARTKMNVKNTDVVTVRTGRTLEDFFEITEKDVLAYEEVEVEGYNLDSLYEDRLVRSTHKVFSDSDGTTVLKLFSGLEIFKAPDQRGVKSGHTFMDFEGASSPNSTQVVYSKALLQFILFIVENNDVLARFIERRNQKTASLLSKKNKGN